MPSAIWMTPATTTRQQKGFVRAERFDLRRHDGGESRGRTADAGVRAAEKADDDAADNSRDQSRDRLGAGRLSDAQTQRQSNKKDDDAGNRVTAEGLGKTFSSAGGRHQFSPRAVVFGRSRRADDHQLGTPVRTQAVSGSPFYILRTACLRAVSIVALASSTYHGEAFHRLN